MITKNNLLESLQILPLFLIKNKLFNFTSNFIASHKTYSRNKLILWAKQIKSSAQDNICDYDKENMFEFTHAQNIPNYEKYVKKEIESKLKMCIIIDIDRS